jgi:hypothetical protein
MPAVPITTRRAAWLTVLWLAAGLALGLVLLASLGTERAVNYWSVYVLERSLSLDNVFVFLLVLDYFVLVRALVLAAILFAGLPASTIGDLVAPPHVTELAKRRPPRCPPGHAAPLEPVTVRPGESEPS